jgi:thymidine kinase
MPKVTIYTGVMKSGKTHKLIEQYNKSKNSKKNILAIKPRIDNRFSDTEIVSRSGLKITADLIIRHDNYSDLNLLYREIQPNFVDEVYISEFHFFPEEMYYFVLNTMDYIKYYIEGLTYNSSNKYMGYLYKFKNTGLAEIIECTTLCEKCKSRTAEISYRLIDNKDEIFVGDKEYEPRCFSCVPNDLVV